jgi:uncharacterized peroxidase-related enzyme
MSFIGSPLLTEQDFPPFAAIQQMFGFIPNFYRAQGDRRDLIEPQMALAGAVIVAEGALERRQKEYIFLAVSARNLSTYCVTAHCEIIRMLKLEGPEPEQIAIDYTSTKIPLRDKALLHFALKLNNTPLEMTQADVDTLRTFGFSDAQIQETIAMTAMARYANTVSFGLGTLPDFQNDLLDFGKSQEIAPTR